jgi:hypothetical protein
LPAPQHHQRHASHAFPLATPAALSATHYRRLAGRNDLIHQPERRVRPFRAIWPGIGNFASAKASQAESQNACEIVELPMIQTFTSKTLRFGRNGRQQHLRLFGKSEPFFPRRLPKAPRCKARAAD